MDKKYKNVLELIKNISDDKKFNKSLEEYMGRRQIGKILFALRCKKGLNQTQLAKKIKHSQGKISKIENSFDDELTIGDVRKFCNAVDIQLEIGFKPINMSLVDRIKYHFCTFMSLINEIEAMSKGDEAMEKGAKEFKCEAVLNLTKASLKLLENIDFQEDKEKNFLRVLEPIDMEELKDKLLCSD